MKIGDKIKKFRKQLRMTQPDLAEKVGVHETTIRRWEKGDDDSLDIKTINKLAEAFNIAPEVLLNPDIEEESDNTLSNEKYDVKSLEYEWGGGHKLRLPDTPETRKLFEKIVLLSMGNSTSQPAMA